MKFKVSVTQTFSAAHNLRNYKGKCEAVHGHNFKVKATVASNKLDEQGMVIDFHMLKKVLNEVLSGLDHKDLNKIAYFKKVNPTSEQVARYIFIMLKKYFKAAAFKLDMVTVWETEGSEASFSG